MKGSSIILLILLLLPFTFAWDTCDVGCTDVAGCGSYIDTNNDGACDHGQEEPIESSTTQYVDLSVPVVDNHDLITGQELKEKTVAEIAEIYSIDSERYAELLSKKLDTNVLPNHKFQTLHDNYALEPSIAKDIAASIQPIKENAMQKKKYGFLPITLITIFLYFTTLILTKKEIIKLQNHRKIWNIVLAVSFFISGILGLLLVIRINYGWYPFSFNMLHWHVESGIVLAWTSIFHALWHIPYFKRIFNFN